jgi:hypothetical protein
MMTDHKATPEQWQADAARWLDAILELRARVEALELGAGIRDAVAKELDRNYPAKPDSSLVERVSTAIVLEDEKHYWPCIETIAADMARAAIREVAAWLREQHNGDLVAATVLEQEAER